MSIYCFTDQLFHGEIFWQCYLNKMLEIGQAVKNGENKNLLQKMYMKHDVSPPAGHTDSGKNSVLVREICLHLQLNEQAGSSEIDLTVNNRLPYT